MEEEHRDDRVLDRRDAHEEQSDAEQQEEDSRVGDRVDYVGRLLAERVEQESGGEVPDERR